MDDFCWIFNNRDNDSGFEQLLFFLKISFKKNYEENLEKN